MSSIGNFRIFKNTKSTSSALQNTISIERKTILGKSIVFAVKNGKVTANYAGTPIISEAIKGLPKNGDVEDIVKLLRSGKIIETIIQRNLYSLPRVQIEVYPNREMDEKQITPPLEHISTFTSNIPQNLSQQLYREPIIHQTPVVTYDCENLNMPMSSNQLPADESHFYPNLSHNEISYKDSNNSINAESRNIVSQESQFFPHTTNSSTQGISALNTAYSTNPPPVKELKLSALDFGSLHSLIQSLESYPCNEETSTNISNKHEIYAYLNGCKNFKENFLLFKKGYDDYKKKIDAGIKNLPTIGQKEGWNHQTIAKALEGFCDSYSKKTNQFIGDANEIFDKLDQLRKIFDKVNLKMLKREIVQNYTQKNMYQNSFIDYKDLPKIKGIVYAYLEINDFYQELQNINQYIQEALFFLKEDAPKILLKILEKQKIEKKLSFSEKNINDKLQYEKEIRQENNRYKEDLRSHFETVHRAIQAYNSSLSTQVSAPENRGDLILTKESHKLNEFNYIQLKIFLNGEHISAEITAYVEGNPLSQYIKEEDIIWRSAKLGKGVYKPNNWSIEGNKVFYQEQS